jgi:hypothetical protein
LPFMVSLQKKMVLEVNHKLLVVVQYPLNKLFLFRNVRKRTAFPYKSKKMRKFHADKIKIKGFDTKLITIKIIHISIHKSKVQR